MNCMRMKRQKVERVAVYLVVFCSLWWAVQNVEWITVRKRAQKEWWKQSMRNRNAVPEGPLKVSFGEPATHWTDAIPIGNGRLGAMLWGAVPSELLQLNAKWRINRPKWKSRVLWTVFWRSCRAVMSNVEAIFHFALYEDTTCLALKPVMTPLRGYEVTCEAK